MDLYGELEWRGLVYEGSEGVRDVLAREREKVTGYIGFDPTASSLHVGSLLQILALVRLRGFGHDSIALVGGGTGLIGDPSGKATERPLLGDEHVGAHVRGIRKQLSHILTSGSRQMRRLQPGTSPTYRPAQFVDNAKWLKGLKAINFMRDVGKHFTVNSMLAKESVKRRLEAQEGISYTEFSYLLLQAYDFLELNRRHKCTLQLGGSDQWGNITAGIELIRRVRNEKVHGLVLPLVTTSSGTKFGKTEAGTIWLDPNRTKPYAFYQFWLNVEDHDAVKYLKFFTFLDRSRIEAIEKLGEAEPEKRHAQRELAQQVTRLVHGDDAVRESESAAQKLFGGNISTMSASELMQVFANVPSKSVPYQPDGWRLVALLTDVGLTKSNSEATKLIRGGGIHVNDRKVTDEKERLSPAHAIEGQVFVVRKGKKDNFLIRIERG